MPIAAKVMAPAPLGQAVAIQNSATGADHHERAPRIDQRGQPVSHVEPDATTANKQSSRVIYEQGQPVKCLRNARESLGRMVSEQAQRRRSGGQRDERLSRQSSQRAGSPCTDAARSSRGSRCRTSSASLRACSGGGLIRWFATVRHPATAEISPPTAACRTGEW